MGSPHSPKFHHYWNLKITLFSVIEDTRWVSLTPFQRSTRLGATSDINTIQFVLIVNTCWQHRFLSFSFSSTTRPYQQLNLLTASNVCREQCNFCANGQELVCSYLGVHSCQAILRKCPAYISDISWIVYETTAVNYFFVGCCTSNLCKTVLSVKSLSGFLTERSWHSYKFEEFRFIQTKRSDFHLVTTMSIKIHIPLRMLISLSVNEILLPSYRTRNH